MVLTVVTGARGFLGRALMPALQGAGFAVRGLVRALDAQTCARADYVAVGDLASCADADLANALHGADAVVHLAALAHRPLGNDEASLAALRRVNVEATERLARAAAAAGARTFVFASSVKVGGESSPRDRPLLESDAPNPLDDYARSKWQAERALAGVAAETGLRAAALRLPLCYGPGAKANVAALARALRRGLPLPLAAIHNRRSVLGTGNFADAVATLLAHDEVLAPGKLATFFVADAEAVSTPDLVRAIARALALSPRLWPLPAPLLRIGAAALGRSDAVERLLGTLQVDTSAFRAAFGWSPPHSLQAGLADAFAPRSPL